MAKNIKFQFDTEFQKEVLHYTIKEPMGYQALKFYNYDTFELSEHQLIAFAIKKYFKKNKRIPSKAVLREYMRTIFNEKQFEDLVDEDLKKLVLGIISELYEEPLLDAEEIYTKTKQFKQFCEIKGIFEEADFHNFEISKFQTVSTRLHKSLNIGEELNEDDGTFLVKDLIDRQIRRKIKTNIIPTPYRQLNHTLNAGGYTRSSLICYIGKAKWFKTGVLVNYGSSTMKQRKKVAYIDFENNEDPIAIRTEQGLGNLTASELVTGEHDKRLAKMMRQYRRIGAEMVIKRFPAYSTTFDDIQAWTDNMKLKHNITFDIFIFDYLGLMGSISRKKEDKDRISDVYVDAKNFLKYNNIALGVTAHHITNEGHIRIGTKFKPTDTAKCLDIHRHVDALIGLNKSDEEREAGVLRMEDIDQREGKEGTALFWVDFEKQRTKEFSKKEIKEYIEQMGDREENTRDTDNSDKAPKRRRKDEL